MDPLTIGLIGGGASLLGSIFSSNTSAQNTQAQIQAQMAMQQQNEQWQTQMSNTAYQRASADMTKAGLNPMMMFGSGGPASTPSIGTPTVPTPQKTSIGAGIGQAVASGISSMVSAKTIDKMGDEMSNLQAENKNLSAQNELIKAMTGGQVQRNIINLPDETKAQLFNTWLREHPNLTTAGEVTRYGGQSVQPVIEGVAQGVASAAGVKRLLMNPANPSKTYTGLGPSGTQTVKDMIDDAMEKTQRK